MHLSKFPGDGPGSDPPTAIADVSHCPIPLDSTIFVSMSDPFGQPAFKPSPTKAIPAWMQLMPTHTNERFRCDQRPPSLLDEHFGRPTHSRPGSPRFSESNRSSYASTICPRGPPRTPTPTAAEETYERGKQRATSPVPSWQSETSQISQIRMHRTSYVSTESLKRPSSRLGRPATSGQHLKPDSDVFTPPYTTPPEYPSPSPSLGSRTLDPVSILDRSGGTTTVFPSQIYPDRPFAYPQGLPAKARITRAPPLNSPSLAIRPRSPHRSKSPLLAKQLASQRAWSRTGGPASGVVGSSLSYSSEYLDRYRPIKGTSAVVPSREWLEKQNATYQGEGAGPKAKNGADERWHAGNNGRQSDGRTSNKTDEMAGESCRKRTRQKGVGTTYGDPVAEGDTQVSNKRLSLQAELKRLFGR
ncbi:hypothetical protein GQ53DRAFT_47334 [Thozetella sp. PMI_491]|nr:hypothetical protein GQ53DRAFT_47334 [Thozetella sp. PMI_491]